MKQQNHQALFQRPLRSEISIQINFRIFICEENKHNIFIITTNIRNH